MKRMGKRALGLFLALVMVMTLLPVTVHAAAPPDSAWAAEKMA